METTKIDSKLPPRPQEAILINHIPKLKGNHILCTSLGRAQFAQTLAEQQPQAEIHCHFFDLYRYQLAQESIPPFSNLTLQCSADFPDQDFDLAAFPTSYTGDAELTKDILQSAHQKLIIGGTLVVTSDNPSDTWLKEEMEKLFSKVHRYPDDNGVLYEAVKTKPLKKIKDYSCEFAFRDQGNLIKAFSRPGVFSHRRLDLGARRLMETMEIRPGNRVLDIGCGWGAVALAATARASDVSVLAIDSYARATQCTEISAQLNNFATVSTKLTATGEVDHPGTYDIVLANPPYYANFRIAELFATAGFNALHSQGEIIFVTKLPQWYEQNLAKWFTNTSIIQAKDYYIVKAYKK